MKSQIKIVALLVGLSGVLLSACSSGSSSGGGGSNSVIKGSLSFGYSGTLQVSSGSVQQVALLLNNSTGVNSQNVSVYSDDSSIASISPAICKVSTSNPYCIVTVQGKKVGNVSLHAAADGYGSLTLVSSIVNGPVYGYLGVESSVFPAPYPINMESSNTVNVQFSSYIAESYPAQGDMPAGYYYTMYVTGGVLYSSGLNAQNLQSATSALFSVAPESNVYTMTGSSTVPSQCPAGGSSLTSIYPICTLQFLVPKSAVDSGKKIKLLAEIAGQINAVNSYSAVNIVGQSNPNPFPGTIAIGAQSMNVPLKMHAPLFLNWTDVAMTGTVSVTLTSSNPSAISFYNYNVGNSGVLESTMPSVSCTLQFPQNTTLGVNGSNGVSCGFGVKGIASGSSTITATVTSESVDGWSKSYTIAPLTMSVVNQDAAIRTILVTNNSSESIAVGITTGGANAYISPNSFAVTPGQVTSQLQKPGGGSMCGISNSFAACPVGSSCRPGGLNPESTSTYYCYYDSPHVNNYVVQSGESTIVSISGSSGDGDPSGIIWSGNFFARTGCDPSTGICTNGTCGTGGLACAPGTGGAPGVMTLSEATFQRKAVGPDYYDVSIINGLNFATSFGPGTSPDPSPRPVPANGVLSSGNGYNCGTAGSSESQSQGLSAALWNITPATGMVSPFPSGGQVGESSSYFRWVSFIAPTPVSCIADSTCTNIDARYRCGFIIQTNDAIADNTIPINESTTSYTRYCGKPIAWLTVDEIYGFESSASAALPFNLSTSFSVSPAYQGTSSVTVGNLQLCNNNTYSAYGSIPNYPGGNNPVGSVMACGGVNWNIVGITTPSAQATTSNPNWVTNVQPTITWLKQTCPTCYTFPYDDLSSTFTCDNDNGSYTITINNPPQ